MPSRILNRQRQLAEQGRLRLGTFDIAANGKGRPRASHHWIITSHWEEYVRKAAELWGGEPEFYKPQGHGVEQWRVITTSAAIDAILPPFEPLMQAYEQWSAGGCQRRCDGGTEQFSGAPCLCIAEFGDDWHLQPAGRVCATKSRLKVLLPDMPGMGSWRLETGSFYAADELAGMVDGIRIAVGQNVLVPVRLRIEPRTRTFQNQTKRYIVPVLELRGITAGELLSGSYRGLGSLESSERKALPGASDSEPAPDYVAAAHEAGDLEAVRQIWHLAEKAGHLSEDLKTELTRIGQSFTVVEPETDEDPDAVWNEILVYVGSHIGWETQQLLDDFPKRSGGIMASDASGADMRKYLNALKTEGVGK